MDFRRRIHIWLVKAAALFRPAAPVVDQTGAIRTLGAALREARQREDWIFRENLERAAELVEARSMAGAGPWLVAESRGLVDGAHKGDRLRESNPVSSQGAFGDIELALQNVEWRREVNLSWLEFSRWGIQQIILISRLYYIKNPIIRRLIEISAVYVFGRGVEVSSPDETANEVLAEFFERNAAVLGQEALVEHEKRKFYDGNLFFAFFADTLNTGKTSVRLIDATEVQDIVTDPDDATIEQLFRRVWTSRSFDVTTGITRSVTAEAWYPAIGFNPQVKPEKINGVPVQWDNPVYHRKCGGVGQWIFGCPIIYPALDWAKQARKFLESCAAIKASLAQFSMTLTSKGGQQAMEGAKQQLMTQVGPAASIWESNPTANDGSIFASGPGTKLEPINTRGAGADPEEVRQYKLMCCMVVGVPETFLADVQTGNLATATSLDRPTELVFLQRQEAWREDLVRIACYVLSVNLAAASGRLREGRDVNVVTITEARRVRASNGAMKYVEAAAKTPAKIEVKATFPSIREGDIPQLVSSVVEAMTLGTGEIIGIDQKAGIGKLFELLGIEDGDEILDAMFKNYDPKREKPDPAAQPDPVDPKTKKLQKSVEAALGRLNEVLAKIAA